VALITRHDDETLRRVMAQSPRVSLVKANLEVVGETRRAIESVNASGCEITAAVFLQRYRPTGSVSLDAHTQVELWSIQEALEATREGKSPKAQVQALR